MSALFIAVSLEYPPSFHPLVSLWLLTGTTVKGVEELVNEFSTHSRDGGYLSCVIAILYFLTIYGLEKLGSSRIWKPSIRSFLADYAYPVGSLVIYSSIRCFSELCCLCLFGIADMTRSRLFSGLVSRIFQAISSRRLLVFFPLRVRSIPLRNVAG